MNDEPSVEADAKEEPGVSAPSEDDGGNDNDTSREPSDFERWKWAAEMAQKSFFNRRTVEWKLALAFWGATLAFTYAAFRSEGVEPVTGVAKSYGPWILGIIYILIWIGSVCCWKYPLTDATAGDRAFQRYYRSLALGERNAETNKPRRLETRKEFGCQLFWSESGETRQNNEDEDSTGQSHCRMAHRSFPCCDALFSDWTWVNWLWFFGESMMTGLLLALSWFAICYVSPLAQ